MRIALIRLGALGDIVVSSIAIALIKQAYPQAQLTWIVDSAYESLLQDTPGLDTLIAIPLKSALRARSLKQLWSIAKHLKDLEPFDCIIDLQGLIKSACVARILCASTRVGYSAKSAKEWPSSLFYSQHAHIEYAKHILARTLALIQRALPLVSNPAHLPAPKSPLLGVEHSLESRFSHFFNTPPILFVLEASRAEKCYSLARFIELGRALQSPIALLWHNQKERAMCIAEALPNAVVLPPLNLQEVKALVAHSSLVIGGDTGVTHMAWALLKPSITLFGATKMERFCLTTPINRCLSAQHHDVSRIEPEAIAALAKSLIGNGA